MGTACSTRRQKVLCIGLPHIIGGQMPMLKLSTYLQHVLALIIEPEAPINKLKEWVLYRVRFPTIKQDPVLR